MPPKSSGAPGNVSAFVLLSVATEAQRPTLPWTRLARRPHPTPLQHMPKNQKASIYVVPQEAHVESKHTQSWWWWLTTSNPPPNQLHKLFQRIEVLCRNSAVWEDFKENVHDANRQARLRVLGPFLRFLSFFPSAIPFKKKEFFFPLTIDLVRVASTFPPYTVALL